MSYILSVLVFLLTSRESLALNLAYGGNAYLSSTAFNGIADRVVDGNTDTKWNGNSCCHTQDRQYSYFIADLGNVATVTLVVIFNRNGGCGERLRNFTIEVAEKNPTGNDFSGFILCNYHPQVASSGEKVMLPCENPTEGRYVKIQLFDVEDFTVCGKIRHVLHICEMEVFAAETTGMGRLFRTREDTRATGTVLFRANISRASECVLQCVQTVRCTALNIHQDADDLVCELLNEVDPLNAANSGTPMSAIGWKHYY